MFSCVLKREALLITARGARLTVTTSNNVQSSSLLLLRSSVQRALPITTLCLQRAQFRSFSSRRGRNNEKDRGSIKADALPFTVSPEEALESFRKWAVDEQGLNYLLNWNSVRITAAYCPVYSFDVNVRFVVTESGRKRFDWKPDIFAVYGKQSVVHLPGLASYAGHTYRRSLINPIHNTALVFLGDQTVPFNKWMLRDMKLANGQRLSVYVDPWNTTRGRAFAVVKEELEGMAEQADNDNSVQVQTELLSSRRVYMPTYAIDYKVLGMQYTAFVSGCDSGAGVSGISHKVFDVSDQDISQASHSFLSQAWNAAQVGARVLGGRHSATAIVILFQFFGNLAVRLLMRLPPVFLLGGAFVGFRKIIQPWMDNRSATADWERQREHEAYMEDSFDHIDDFVDSGAARRYFQSNRGRILRHLSGEYQHERGDFDWYKDWEQWARQQWEQQQQQQQTYQRQTYEQQQRQRQQQRRQEQYVRQKPKPKYQWDFDPDDPYSVLGIKRGASKEQVSAAFRKQMMAHHPDMQAGASEAEKARAVERSKLITEAYRKIKAEMKR